LDELKLSAEEQAMLDGAEGPGVQRAMEIVVALSRIYGAADLVPVTHVQVAGVSYKNLGDAGVEFLNRWADEGARVRVPTTLNPMGMERGKWQQWGISPDFATPQLSVIDAFVKMGVTPTLSCTPYLFPQYTPRRGDALAWAESSAVAYANSVIGARSNREGGPSAIAAAIVGRTARYGCHLDENRRANWIVEVRCPVRSVADFGALSYVVGKAVGNGVPWFADLAGPHPQPFPRSDGGREWPPSPTLPPFRRGKGVAPIPDPSPVPTGEGSTPIPDPSPVPTGEGSAPPLPQRGRGWGWGWEHPSPAAAGEGLGVGVLKTLGAGLAAYGAVALYHIAGLTPEARDLGESLIRPDARRLVVESLDDAYRVMDADPDLRKIDLVTIGCPHASLDEIQEVAEHLRGKTLATRLWVTTGEITRQAAVELGYVQTIEAAGGEVVADTCAVVAPMRMLNVRTMATNAGKMACYAPMHSGVQMRFGDMEACLDAAVTGEWRRANERRPLC
jgi:predicted aconitase